MSQTYTRGVTVTGGGGSHLTTQIAMPPGAVASQIAAAVQSFLDSQPPAMNFVDVSVYVAENPNDVIEFSSLS